ncbi:DUF6261 family protein [Phocaeicola sp.]
MVLQTLKNQSRLTVGEFGNFLNDFLDTYNMYTTKKVVVEAENDEENKDIDLSNKQIKMRDSLNAFNAVVIHSVKMPESGKMTEIDKLRYKKVRSLIALIRSYLTDENDAIREAAINYNVLTNNLKGLSTCTNAEQSNLISNFVNTIQNDIHKEAFALLKLEERTRETKEANDEYIRLSKERDDTEKNRVASSSDCRQQCMLDYRHLVSLINFAQESNDALLYDEMIKKLSAQTIRVQELVNRRAKAAAARKRGEVYEQEDIKELKMEDDMVEMENNMDNVETMEA